MSSTSSTSSVSFNGTPPPTETISRSTSPKVSKTKEKKKKGPPKGCAGIRKGIPNTFKKEDFVLLSKKYDDLKAKYKKLSKETSKLDLLLISLVKKVNRIEEALKEEN
ncbi:hypothetical protein CERZMDRAFT_89496 [Cercospora zeae-maydis SCOH1-5]|uniref:Uncharacterized protein n=1 Tax=Cercospora zeae-maydis SCOH1-5 TaxID=717836 RepID=A0A6A6EYJ3_9PEZI|nr:hypothetical protein CERZMDRAFT_89496 [Cercospora zeae-maydis SCOH1-5]